ncbi:MAG TPA: AAA family ATPase [Solirubrobacteraceae bacterium]|nr:AAA family ATPase [Solirubrobacteraceae bacterium]
MHASREPPKGTIALLFTDIEGSTGLARELGSEWAGVLADHHALVGGAIAAEGGFVDGIEGDAFFAAFVDAEAAARAAVQALRELRSHPWPREVGELGVRMGLHVGRVERRATGYVGLEVHRAARVGAAAHGGQLLLTDAARALIGDAVPVEPLGAHRLKDFPAPELLFCAVVDGRGAAAFPAPRTEQVRPTNLPAGAPVLVGREDDLGQLRSALLAEGERLVTLTGRGGVGKTSLALVAATGLLDEHPGGVWLVGLATVSTPDEVLPAVAFAIGAEGDVSSSPLEAVIAHLRERGPTLLVLDSVERLVAVAPTLASLLAALPELRVLVTSQTPLRIAAERCLPLDALDDEAALALIARVARRRGAALSAEAADHAALLDVVHLLDGLPLALELVAARLAVLSPAQLRERLPDSAELLKDAGGERPERQRSLRATVEWTLDALDERARALFARMGAFAGPVELEDIEAVTGREGLDTLVALEALLEVALVRRVESGDGQVRFGLPEALRQIAASLLDATSDGKRWRRAHAQRQHDLLSAAPVWLSATAPLEKALAADAEAAAALRWARENDDMLGASLGAARACLLSDSGRVRETLAVLEPLLEKASGDPAVDGRALVAHSHSLAMIDRLDDSLVSAERAVAIAPDAMTRALALTQRSVTLTFRGEHEAAVHDGEESVAVARTLGPAALSGALLLAAQAHLFEGDLGGAAERLAEAERIGAPADASKIRAADTLRGDLAIAADRPADALEHYANSLEAAQAREDHLQVLFDLMGIATALAALRDDDEALEVVGLAAAQSLDISGPGSTTVAHLLGSDSLLAAEERAGATRAGGLKARGNAVPAGNRVTHACQLARLRQPA